MLARTMLATGATRLRWLALPLLVLSVAACSGDTDRSPTATIPAGIVQWPAPSDPLERSRAAGLEPQPRENFDFHVHAHLDIVIDGQPVEVPAGIGINIDDPGVQHFQGNTGGTAYGRIEGCDQPCISPLHSHDRSGVIHTESTSASPNLLGAFFVEWGVRLDASCVGDYCQPATPIVVYVDGERYSGNPADIALTDQLEIAILIGVPPEQIPRDYDFSDA